MKKSRRIKDVGKRKGRIEAMMSKHEVSLFLKVATTKTNF